MKFQNKEVIIFVLQQFVLILILRVDKKTYPQGYLEQCKLKMKKRELVDLIDDEVDLSSSDSDNLDD